MNGTTTAAESGIAVVAKATPPISVSIATISGIQVSEIVLWATLIYTCLLIGHKVIVIYKDLRGSK